MAEGARRPRTVEELNLERALAEVQRTTKRVHALAPFPKNLKASLEANERRVKKVRTDND